MDIQNRLDQLRAESGPIGDSLESLSSDWDAWLSAVENVTDLLQLAQAARPQRGHGLLTTPVTQHPDAGSALGHESQAAAAETLPAGDEEEALLATLDERTAALVRIRRRLSMNRKSIRECLAEIQHEERSAGAKPETPVKKPGWWS